MLKQGAVRVDGDKINDRTKMLNAGAVYICQVGKRRIARIRVSE